MSYMINDYPLAINGQMGAMGITASERKAQADAKRLENQKRQEQQKQAAEAARAERQQAQALAVSQRAAAAAAQKAQRAETALQRKQTQAARKQTQQMSAADRKQQQQAAAQVRQANADKVKVVNQIKAEIRQIDAARKQNPNLPPEWIAYRACLEERLRDVAIVCVKPNSTLRDVQQAAAKAKQSAKQEAAKAGQDARKKLQEDKRKTQQQLKEERKKKDQQTVSQISPALKNQLSALQKLAQEVRAIRNLPLNQRKAAADAIVRRSGELLGQDVGSRLSGWGMGSLGDCRTVYIPGKGYRQYCDTVSFNDPPPAVVGGNIVPLTGPIQPMPDSATYWDQRFQGRIGTKKDLAAAYKACTNKAYKRFPDEQALCWTSLWEDTPGDLRKFFNKKAVKDYQLRGMRGMGEVIFDPVLNMYIDSVTGQPASDPNAGIPGSNYPVPTGIQIPGMSTLPLPKGGCEGKKASKPVCMFYTLAAESQQMLYTVVQQIIALQNEILLVLNEIRSTGGGGAPITGGFCDPSGQWINADGTIGGSCNPNPISDPYQDPGYYQPPYQDPYQQPGYGYQPPPTTMPVDGGYMDAPMDVYPGAPTTPYGYNQPYNPYQQVPDMMQLPADSSGGDLFSDGGADYIPQDVPINQWASQQFYPQGGPVMDFTQIPSGGEVIDDVFGGGEMNVPGDISIYGSPYSQMVQASQNVNAQDQTFVMPGYSQSEFDQPLVVQEMMPGPLDPEASLLIPDDTARAAANAAKALQQNQFDQNKIFYDSFEGGSEDFF